LLAVARVVQERDVPSALSATEAALESIGDVPQGSRTNYILAIAQLLIRLGSNKEAMDLIEKVEKAAAGLYELDTRSDNPNRAPIAQWPSTQLYRDLVTLISKLNARRAAETVDGVADEMQPFIRTSLAISLMRLPPLPDQVIDSRKTFPQ
jgi:hypothetical protein